MKRLVTMFAFVLFTSQLAVAQVVATPMSHLAIQQAAADLATAQGYTYRLAADGALTGTVAAPTCSGSVSPFTCTMPIGKFTAGPHTVRVSAANAAGESPLSPPLTFQMVLPPSAPANLQIVVISPPPVMPAPPVDCTPTNARCVPSEYATIQACANAAVAGDTCWVSPGLYNERVTPVNPGTAGNVITYRATSDCVSNNGATIASNCAKVRGWAIGDSYITVQGFEVTNEGMSADPNNRPIFVNGTDQVMILNNYVHDFDAQHPCLVGANSTNLVFRGNHVKLCAERMSVFATIRGPYNIQTGVNDKISISVQGGAAQTITLTAGAARTVGQLYTDVVNASITGALACVGITCTGQFEIVSSTVGPTSSLEVLAVANDAYTTLGMSVGTGTMHGYQSAFAGAGSMTDWLIEQNHASHVGDYFNPGTGDMLVARNNTFGPSDTYNSVHIDAFQSGVFTKVLAEGNRSIDNTSSDNHFLLNETAATHWIVRFNETCRAQGGVSFSGGANFNYWYNNTFWDNFAYMFGNRGHQIRFINAPNNKVRNNIWYKSLHTADAIYGVTGTGAFDGDYDLWYLSADLGQANDVNADPLVMNGATCDFTLQAGSPAIDEGGPLTTVAAADTGSGTSLVVTDAKPFQDGWGGVTPDTLAVGTVGNTALISSIDYATNTITLVAGISRSDGDAVWLYANSRGTRVLYGTAPDIGARERVP